MLKLKSEITINSLVFDYVVNVEISDTWENITSTGLILIPNKFRIENEEVKIEFTRGDKVIIKLGYLYTLEGINYDSTQEIFIGYVSRVLNDDIIQLHIEDSMYLLKQKNIQKYTGDNLIIKDFIEDLFDLASINIEVEYIDETINIGDWRIQNKNIAEILYQLRKFGLYARFEGEILKIDTPYDITLSQSERQERTKDFKFQYNIINSNLEYRLKTDLNTVVKGLSLLEDDTKIELYASYNQNGTIITSATAPANIGTQITHTTYNQTQAQLKDTIKKLLPTVHYEGYYGSFTTFGLPYVKPGFFANIIDDKYPERDGRYIIKRTNYSFGQNGFRQNIELGIAG